MSINTNSSVLATKSYAETYLYNVNTGLYEKKLIDFILKADRVDKDSEAFEDIKYDVKKRQITNFLVKVLESNNVVLLYQSMPLPKAFKVFTAKDLKGDHKVKVFIDISDNFRLENGKWKCYNIDVFIAHLVSAMTQVIYFADPKRLLMRDGIINKGASAFSSLFTYIIDYLFKISTVSSTKDKCIYLSSIYYMVNILGKDMNNDSTKRLCRNLAGISEKEEELINIQIDQEKCYMNINFFILEINKVLRLPKLTLDAFLEKWIYIYGTGTQFSLELFTAFSTMITNVYVGCYLNNQKTIEKIIGRDVVEMTKTILTVGGESI